MSIDSVLRISRRKEVKKPHVCNFDLGFCLKCRNARRWTEQMRYNQAAGGGRKSGKVGKGRRS